LVWALCLLPSAAVFARSWTEEPRKVLALYLPDEIDEERKIPYFTWLHLHAEMPLNHIGLELEYVDASKPLPDLRSLEGVRGVVSWFSSPKALKDPRAVCRWLESAMKSGLKVVLLGELGVYSTEAPSFRMTAECRSMLSELGMRAHGAVNIDPLAVSVAASDQELMGFERKPDPSEDGVIPLVRLAGPGRTVLRLRLREGDIKTVEPAAVTSRGAWALNPFFFYANNNVRPRQVRWVVDPFRFFEEAFGAAGLPRPDVTTLSGRRVYFFHVDGDGEFSRSDIHSQKSSGEIFLEEIIGRYPRDPMTLGLVTGYHDLTLFSGGKSLALSRELLSRPNVEPGSHGYAHPLDWDTGELGINIPRYSMDGEKEIVGSVRIIEDRLLPGTRKVRLFQWTGNCLPKEEHLRLAEENGIMNINGGGGRMDGKYASYGFLFPLGRRLGKQRQVYTGAMNEYVYTNDWDGPFYGYRDVVETFKRTGSPRRVKPVNVYVHFYAAQKYAALRAIRKVLDWVRTRPLAPVRTTRYVEAVRGFFDMRLLRDGPRRFRLEGGDKVATVRFDGVSGVPRMRASKGVLGYKREKESLYVSLAPGPEREIVLADSPGPGVRLEEANFEVLEWKPGGGGVRFRIDGWWDAEFTLGGLTPGAAYRIRGPGEAFDRQADASGRFKMKFPPQVKGRPAGWIVVEPVS